MAKVFWQVIQTLDGFMEGPKHDLSDTAEIKDPDFDRYGLEMLQSIDGMILGRRTYELFNQYWPKAKGPDADLLNALPKLVFSRTLQKLEWNNATLAQGSVTEEIMKIKKQNGRDWAVFGSANLAETLAQYNFIDEFRVIVSPIVLGQGTPTFKTYDRTPLKLTNAQTWSTGLVILTYRPAE